MSAISRISAAVRHMCPGVITGARAVLRPFEGKCNINRRGVRKAVPFSVSAVPFLDVSQNPSIDGEFCEISKHVYRRDAEMQALTPVSHLKIRDDKTEVMKVAVKNRFFAAKAILTALFTLSLASASFSAATIDNIAKAAYSVDSSPAVSSSNSVSIVIRTKSTVEFMKYAPLASDAEKINVSTTKYVSGDLAKSLIPIPAPVQLGSAVPVDMSSPIPLAKASFYKDGEPIFIRLTDKDQNLDPSLAETVFVTIICANNPKESEELLLTETGPDTGVFVGYIQSTSRPAVSGDGLFSVDSYNCQILIKYTDAFDNTDSSIAAALADPYGMIFDSATGLPVNGAEVTLIDASTGQPAVVYGDNGVSTYPSKVVSGGFVKDDSGKVYSFPAGMYRFPFIAAARYRLLVAPPAGYRAPSSVPDSTLQSLPGAPFYLHDPGSRAGEFIVNVGPALRIDIPVDPIHTWLYLTKTAAKPSVSVGDFLQYKITIENTSTSDINGVVATDGLPLGFRYRRGSTKINSATAADPTISSDGRTLTFSAVDLAGTKTADITYVVEIAVGAKTGNSTNWATAAGSGGITANTATATVQVTEDLFGSKSIILGSVSVGCGDMEHPETDGLGGIRIYLEDGTYVVTDKKGMYHFAGLKPGTHVVQLDLETIPKDYELISCSENTRIAGTPYSQFVDVQGGSMWRSDFNLALKPKEKSGPEIKEKAEVKGEVGIELTSSFGTADIPDKNNEPGKGRNLEYRLFIHIGAVQASNNRLSVMLPEGVAYKMGSSSIGENTLPDPIVTENVLTYRLGDSESNHTLELRFDADVAAEGKPGDLITEALLTFDSPGTKNLRTPLVENTLLRVSGEEHKANSEITLHPHFEVLNAELTKEDKLTLDRLIEELKKDVVFSISVAGHTDSTPVRKRSKHKYADNYELSKARAESVGYYIAEGLDLPSSQVIIAGEGPDRPIATNETAEGRALNRRVEMRVISEKVSQWSELKNDKGNSGIKQVEFVEPWPAEKPSTVEKEKESRLESDKKTMPEFNSAWLETAAPGFEWLWPYEGHHPPIPSMKIAIKHDPKNKIKLFLNGEEVNPLNFDGSLKRNDGKVAVSLWRGITLTEGDNHFDAVEYGDNGAEDIRIKRTIHYSGTPVKIELVPAQSRLTADGKTPPVLAVRLTDKDGHPAREGVVGEYSLDPPYLPLQKVEDLQKDPLTASKSEKFRYLVGENGMALIELQPTSKTGEAAVRFQLANGDHEMRAWLNPEDRNWILVGLAEGTAGYNAVSGNMESLKNSDVEDKYYKDGRVAFFAKGMIKGKWLLTIAYDSDKNGIIDKNSLYQIIDPNRYYTLYGDATTQQSDAASARSLYLKIERDKFYALFGDFETGLTVAELSRYSRSLNGFKSEMKGERYDFNVFASDTNQAFVKDEIRGDGTSGLYRLSRKNIVMNSESMTIETRDRFRSEVIISSHKLSRYIDYSIDYDAGTIYFKSPVFTRDENFNPVYIVVDYESFDTTDMSYNYGGRGAVKFMDNRLEIGATHVHEGSVGGEGNLEGIDAYMKVNDKTSVRTELAATNTDLKGSGRAYIAELSHRSEKLEGKVYVREQDGDFGLGQQRGSETGTRKLGFDGTYRLNEKISVKGDAYRQYNLSVDAVRDLAETRVLYAERKYDLHAGLRHAEDTLGNGVMNNSEQITAGGNYRLMDDRLTLRLERDQSLMRNNANSDFPTRTTMGADYKLNDTATLFVAQEFTQGENEDTETTRIGMKATPWSGGQISSTVEQQSTENGVRVFSVSGLKQTWQITKKWSVDAGLDRSSTLKHPGNASFNTNVPAASGNSDFTAVSLGAAYKEERWTWTGRIETRDSDDEKKVGIFTGVYGELKEGIGLSAALQGFRTESVTGPKKTNGDLRFGLAYRPRETTWVVLDRFDYLFDKQDGSDFNFDNWRIVNNLNMNFKINRCTQLAVLYGAKYVKETIDNQDYTGYTDLTGLEGRYDVTKKWDIGLRGNILHSWEADQFKYGTGASVGYSFVKNVWLSVGYNFTGFRDRDFSKADFTAEGPFVKFRMKFDQGSASDAVKWFTGQ